MKKFFLTMVLICISLSCCGCGDDSKEQKIVVYDYTTESEKEYSSDNIEINEFINDISDLLLDGEAINADIPEEVQNYKRIILYQKDKKSKEEEKLIDMEIYVYDDEYYCETFLSFSQQSYEIKLPPELAKRIEFIWKE